MTLLDQVEWGDQDLAVAWEALAEPPTIPTGRRQFGRLVVVQARQVRQEIRA